MTTIPPFEVTTEMLNKIVQITEIVTTLELTQRRNFHLRKENRLRSIQSSLAIEANSLSLEQVTDIINGKRVLGKPQEIKEVQNAYQAYEHIFTLNPYQVQDFLKAHGLLTQNLLKESGQFRSKDVGIFDGAGNVVHMGARPQYVNTLVGDLFDWAGTTNQPTLIKSSVVHYELEKIHPFGDGNGRMGRLWQNLILAKGYSVFEYLPIESMIYKHQQAYYQALADNAGATSFIDFMLNVILETITDSDLTSDKGAILRLSPTEVLFFETVRDFLLKYDTINNHQAQELTGKASATVRKYFVKLLAEGLLSAEGKNKARKYLLKK